MTSSISNTTSKRVVLDYTSRDYKAIRSMLVGLAKGIMPDWETVGETGDFGTLLLELYAYTGDVMNYYIDRVASEAYLGTAVRRQSVMYIADMFGYRPMGQRAATVPITFTWEWDTDNFPGGIVPTKTYTVSAASASNGVATLSITSTNAIDVVAQQTIVVSGIGAPFDGRFVVVSTTDSTSTEPFKLTYKISDLSVLTGTVSGSSAITTGGVVIIPAGTVVSTRPSSDGTSIQFETDFQVVLDTATGTSTTEDSTIRRVVVPATASEGLTVTPFLLGTSQGIPNAEFVISDVGVIDRSISVFTKEGGQVIPWSRVDKMALATPTQSVFTTYVDDRDYTHVLFGDNASGRIPPANTEVYVGYRYGVGAKANNLGVNTLTTLSSDYATSLGVTVSNTASPIGGADVESVESMRYSIPRSNALKQRAVTLDDYINLALQVPGITKATAYGANYTSVYVRIASGPQSVGYTTTKIIGVFKNSNDIVIAFDEDTSMITDQIVYIEDLDALLNSSALASIDINGTYTTEAIFHPTNPSTIVNKKIVASTDIATITTAGTHGFSVGQPVTISGVDSTFNGTHVILTTTATAFTFKKTYSGTDVDAVVSSPSAVVVGASGMLISHANTATNSTELIPLGVGATSTTIDAGMRILINALESYLSDKKLIGSVVYGEPVEWTDAELDVSVRVRALYNRESVRAAVQAAIEDVFSYNNVDFGRRVSIGDVYRAGLSVDGVEYITVNTLRLAGSAGTVEDINSSDPADPNGDPENAYRIPRISPTITSPWVTATGGLANT